MDITVTESVYGTLVPQHLLRFEGDTSLHSYYRQVVERNYGRGVVTVDAGRCQICCLPLTVHNNPRMKSGLKMTRKICKLLDVCKDRPKSLGKYQMYLAKKYLDSSSRQVVKCTACGHMNSRTILTNEAKLMVKEKYMQNVQQAEEAEAEITESSKKKKKKKKKRKKDSLDDSGLIIPDSLRIKDTTPGIGTTTLLRDKLIDQTPTPVIIQSRSLPKTISEGSKTHHDKNSGGLAFQSKKLFSTPLSQRKKTETALQLSTKSKKGQQKRLQLKEILSKDQPVQAKSSLMDFLSLL